MITHPIPPLFDKNSKILILGSFPSVKSREAMFFYGHPQNRFWRVLSSVLNHPLPQSVDEKKAMLARYGIALWDVIAQCEITGSADTSITEEKVNDISIILNNADIKAIFTNGKKAHSLYESRIYPVTNIKSIYLPSTSPANAVWSLDKLVESWKVIKEYI